ncbi:hypothetical protein HK096_006474, partial [Nowakowskiella sp. JEL0078]
DSRRVAVELGSWCAERRLEISIEELYLKSLKRSTKRRLQEPRLLDKELEQHIAEDKIIFDVVNMLNAKYIKDRKVMEPRLETQVGGFAVSKVRATGFHPFRLFPRAPKPTLENLSPKTRLLMDVLSRFKEHNFCGIVFVERRVTAYILHMLVKQALGLENLSPGILVGHGNENGNNKMKNVNKLGSNSMSTSQQKEIVKMFSDGTINLLIATSVAEEGLDIQPCNVVIRFDIFTTLINYIQSRGRARHRDSMYVIFAEQNNHAHHQIIDRMRVTEQSMRETLKENEASQTEFDLRNLPAETLDPSEVFLISTTNATVTYNTAIRILYMYINSLPINEHVDAMPKFQTICVSNFKSDSEALSKLNNLQTGWKGKVILPMNVPENCREVISQGIHANQKRAKRAAAFEAVRRLYLAGEIDDRLKPRKITKKPIEAMYDLRVPACLEGSWKIEGDGIESVDVVSNDNLTVSMSATVNGWLYVIEIEEKIVLVMKRSSEDSIIQTELEKFDVAHSKIERTTIGESIRITVYKKPALISCGLLVLQELPNTADLSFSVEGGNEDQNMDKTEKAKLPVESVVRTLNVKIHSANYKKLSLSLNMLKIYCARRFHVAGFRLVLRSSIPILADWAYFVVPICPSGVKNGKLWKSQFYNPKIDYHVDWDL